MSCNRHLLFVECGPNTGIELQRRHILRACRILMYCVHLLLVIVSLVTDPMRGSESEINNLTMTQLRRTYSFWRFSVQFLCSTINHVFTAMGQGCLSFNHAETASFNIPTSYFPADCSQPYVPCSLMCSYSAPPPPPCWGLLAPYATSGEHQCARVLSGMRMCVCMCV